MTDRLTRRNVLRLGAGVSVTALAGCPGLGGGSPDTETPDTAGEEASTFPDEIFMADVRRTGHWEGESVPEAVRLAWSKPGINKGDHSAAKASPLVYDGQVIVPGDVNTVFSFDPDGSLNWNTALHPSGNGTHATPAIVDGTIYTSAYDGAVYAIDAATGKIDWRSKVSDAIGSSPVYYDGKILIATEFYTPSGGMSVLDAETGGLLWEDNRMTNHAHSITGLDPDMGIFAAGCNDGNLYAWSLADQSFHGKFETGGDIKGPICMARGRAYFGSWDTHFYAVDLESMEEEWSYEGEESFMAGPAVHPGSDTIVTGSHEMMAYGFDIDTGEKKWDYDTDGRVLGGFTVAGDTVMFGSYQGRLIALDVSDGSERWIFDEPPGWVTSAPAIAGDEIYVTARATDDSTGRLYKLRAA